MIYYLQIVSYNIHLLIQIISGSVFFKCSEAAVSGGGTILTSQYLPLNIYRSIFTFPYQDSSLDIYLLETATSGGGIFTSQ